ncbi:primosomal protein [Pseudokineococcus marinus]|uniref:Primosomal protein n=1 Tax=Pseudokineococcus marinus TaxID=351215 RepID=A0A849BI23_9ACTN|nr:primosomal protein [Pseudokineococcus marinus]NNH22820.1 primosomal protein [Pseudokineococcus marinus]
MSTEPRAALARLVGALEAHLDAVERRRSETDPVVKDAYQSLSDAFETYDEALYDAFDEVTPFVLFDDSDEDDDDLEDDDEDDEDEDEDDDDLEDDDEDRDDDDEDDSRPRL